MPMLIAGREVSLSQSVKEGDPNFYSISFRLCLSKYLSRLKIHLIRFNAVLLAKRAVRCGRESRSPFVNGPIASLSDDESDVDELEA